MNEDIKKAEQQLQEKADRERKAHLSSHDYAIEQAVAFHKEMVEAHALTLHSVQTLVKTTDGKGNIHTSVLRGLTSNPTTEGSSVTYSNIKSRRERTDRIRQIIWEVEELIEKLKKGDPVPDALKSHFAALRKSIPDRNELELLGKPKASNRR